MAKKFTPYPLIVIVDTSFLMMGDLGLLPKHSHIIIPYAVFLDLEKIGNMRNKNNARDTITILRAHQALNRLCFYLGKTKTGDKQWWSTVGSKNFPDAVRGLMNHSLCASKCKGADLSKSSKFVLAHMHLMRVRQTAQCSPIMLATCNKQLQRHAQLLNIQLLGEREPHARQKVHRDDKKFLAA